MIRRGALARMFSVKGARKKYLLVIVNLLLIGLLERFIFPVNDVLLVSEPYQKDDVYE